MRDHEPLIDELLGRFRQEIGADLEKYANHVHRVFETCVMRDTDPANRHKYAIAAVFHDIGIWTAHTIDYLPPSMEQAEHYLNTTQGGAGTAEITIGLWYDEAARDIHLRIPGQGLSTVSADAAGKRGNPHLFNKLSKVLREQGKPHPEIVENLIAGNSRT